MSIRLRVKPNLVVESMGEEVVLYLPESDEVLVLNASATAVFHQIDGTVDAQDVVDRIAARFAVDTEHVSADVTRVLQELTSRGFVELVEHPGVDDQAMADQTSDAGAGPR